jgi:hypothetical protein
LGGSQRDWRERQNQRAKPPPISAFSLPQSPPLHPAVLLPPHAFSPTPCSSSHPCLLHPAGCSPAGRRLRRNHTAMEGQRPRLEVVLEMEDLLHSFVSSGFVDRPDASACRTTTSSMRDGEVGGHESAPTRGGRRSWRLGFPHQVNGLRIGQIWSAGRQGQPLPTPSHRP